MAHRADTLYDLRDFDTDDFWIESQLAASATYYFPSLDEPGPQHDELAAAIGDLLDAATLCGGVDRAPNTIRDQHLVVFACRGYDAVGLSIIETSPDLARDVVSWVEPTHAAWIERVLKVELLTRARDAGIDHVAVRAGSMNDAIYQDLCVPVATHPLDPPVHSEWTRPRT